MRQRNMTWINYIVVFYAGLLLPFLASLAMNVRAACVGHVYLNPFWILSKNLGFSVTIFLLGYVSRIAQYLTLFLIGLASGLLASPYGSLGLVALLPHGVPEIVAISLFADEGYRYFKLNTRPRLVKIVIALTLLIVAALIESYITPTLLELVASIS